jgi:hypothetical protein
MQQEVHEVQFVGRVVQWLAVVFHHNGKLPFKLGADIEGRARGSRQRRDLTIYADDGSIAITGEVKLPWAVDGHSPLNDAVVNDARKKAQKANSKFFFTWNVNECVLWETWPREDRAAGSYYHHWKVVEISKPGQLDDDYIVERIRAWLRQFLYDCARFYLGQESLKLVPLDEDFLRRIESHLQSPVLSIRDELVSMQKDKVQRRPLNDWLVNSLGYTVDLDHDGMYEQLTRAAKFACYVFVNRLAFYEALRRDRPSMPSLKLPAKVHTGEDLRQHISQVFAQARAKTGDYETVFGEDRASYGDTIPFRSDQAVSHWRALIDQLNRFNFGSLDHEVIGLLFEKLISPKERKEHGQFYTSVEVVDLINSFCLRRGDENVLDPACGGGTFLVRAYVRMREQKPGMLHAERLERLFGVDIEHFPVHLTTINLSVRDLVESDNYPRVRRDDFLRLPPEGVFTQLPRHSGVGKARKLEHEDIATPRFDAVVANPPYIRQEFIKPANKERYQQLVKGLGYTFSGRSDIHVYFWPHAAQFLKPGGYLGFITSSQWLDVDYGFKLQEWMLKHFRILALIESASEPWFEGARVTTTVAILHQEQDPELRMNNVVRFVQVRRPLQEVMGHSRTDHDTVHAADAFRDELLSLTENTVSERYRARLIRQGDLEEKGKVKGKYAGGKWGMYLRAPDLWFELLDEFGGRFTPLGQLAQIRFGVKSGKDDFFFPIDCTKVKLAELATESARAFEDRFGVPRKLVESGDVKLVRCGEGRGEIRPLEAKYLEPEVHSLMEISGFVVKREECKRLILLLPTVERQKMDRFARRYVEWGESKGWQNSPTCVGRVSKDRHWYDLTESDRYAVILPKIQQYKLTTILNPGFLYNNSSLLGFSAKDNVEVAGILNSTWTILSRLLFARGLGNEGNIQLDVYAANIMLVPDPRKATDKQRQRVASAFNKMAERPALQFLSERRMRRMAYRGKYEYPQLDVELNKLSDKCELDMPDRRELDDAVLEMIGIESKARRTELIGQLYAHLREFFETVRSKEEDAIVNKNKTRRALQARPDDIADQILEEIKGDYRWAIKRYDDGFLYPTTMEYKSMEIPRGTQVKAPYEVLGGWRVEFLRGKRRDTIIELEFRAQAELLALLATVGYESWVGVPFEEPEAEQVLKAYREHLDRRQQLFGELVRERTDDTDLQDQIMRELQRSAIMVW